MEKFKFLSHTADIKFQAFGKTLNECFENSALAFTNSQYKGKIKAVINKKIKAKGKDYESLMYNFLEEVLVLLEGGFIVSKVNVKIDEKKLKLNAELKGDYAKNYELSMDAKAITYNNMFIRFNDKKKLWIAQVVVDV